MLKKYEIEHQRSDVVQKKIWEETALPSSAPCHGKVYAILGLRSPSTRVCRSAYQRCSNLAAITGFMAGGSKGSRLRKRGHEGLATAP